MEPSESELHREAARMHAAAAALRNVTADRLAAAGEVELAQMQRCAAKLERDYARLERDHAELLDRLPHPDADRRQWGG